MTEQRYMDLEVERRTFGGIAALAGGRSDRDHRELALLSIVSAAPAVTKVTPRAPKNSSRGSGNRNAFMMRVPARAPLMRQRL